MVKRVVHHRMGRVRRGNSLCNQRNEKGQKNDSTGPGGQHRLGVGHDNTSLQIEAVFPETSEPVPLIGCGDRDRP